MKIEPKQVEWVGDSLKQVRSFPEEAKRQIGSALFDVQIGSKPPSAKPLRGLGSGILEIVTRHRSDTYRTVYAVQIGDRVYVLHAFQKKSKHGIKTAKPVIDLIRQRYRQAVEIEKRYSNG